MVKTFTELRGVADNILHRGQFDNVYLAARFPMTGLVM